MPQAQGLDACNPSDLQDNKPLTAKWMKRDGLLQPNPMADGIEVQFDATVPCVVDRLIQQALLQVLQGRWDPTFSEYSYGFRPGRSAHQAVAQAQTYVAKGFNYVVDIDLERFFDRVQS